MSLPTKERFKITDIMGITVAEGENGEPYSFNYTPSLWKQVGMFEILGTSNESDLIPKDIPLEVVRTGVAKQYIATDRNGELYNAYVYGLYDANKKLTYHLGALKSIPAK